MSNFETEGAALLDAVMGRPVAKSDIQENYDLGRHMTGSANHKMGSIPAWGLDAFRRKDMAVVTDVLLWSEWYSSQPLHENEALSSAMYYRKRIDDGTYALARRLRRPWELVILARKHLGATTGSSSSPPSPGSRERTTFLVAEMELK